MEEEEDKLVFDAIYVFFFYLLLVSLQKKIVFKGSFHLTVSKGTN